MVFVECYDSHSGCSGYRCFFYNLKTKKINNLESKISTCKNRLKEINNLESKISTCKNRLNLLSNIQKQTESELTIDDIALFQDINFWTINIPHEAEGSWLTFYLQKGKEKPRGVLP